MCYIKRVLIDVIIHIGCAFVWLSKELVVKLAPVTGNRHDMLGPLETRKRWSQLLTTLMGYFYVSGWTNMQRVRLGIMILK